MQIRPYSLHDHTAFVAATAQLQDYIASLDDSGLERSGTDFDATAYADWSLRAADVPDGCVLVAEENAVLVGYLVAAPHAGSERDQIECFPSKEGEILELFVDAAHRKQKVGYRLMQAAEQHFHGLGYNAILVDCFAPNIMAHDFYKQYGFNDRLLSMRKNLQKKAPITEGF